LNITDDRFTFARNTAKIDAEAALDGVYVVRTTVAEAVLDRTVSKSPSTYRGFRLDRRTTFDARFWLAAVARFDTLRGFKRDALFETRKPFEDLSGCASTIAAGTSSCALVSTATAS
jgi:hypothetical protein